MSVLKKVCVKNLHGTAYRDVPTCYTSWLDFCGAQKPCKCANIECCNLAEVGAHVKKQGELMQLGILFHFVKSVMPLKKIYLYWRAH